MCIFLLHVGYQVCRSLFLCFLKLSGLFRDSSVICCLHVLLSWSYVLLGVHSQLDFCPAVCQHFWDWPLGKLLWWEEALHRWLHRAAQLSPSPPGLDHHHLLPGGWWQTPVTGLLHCQPPGRGGLEKSHPVVEFSRWAASRCSWNKTQTPPCGDWGST